MRLAGSPKTYDHPKVTRLEVGDEVSDGNFMLVKSMSATSTNWIEYQVTYPNSPTPTTKHLIRITAGDSLHGPFSYVKHKEAGSAAQSGGSTTGTATDTYSLVYEVED